MAFSCLRPTGTLLVVGLPSENICFPPILMASGEVRIRERQQWERDKIYGKCWAWLPQGIYAAR